MNEIVTIIENENVSVNDMIENIKLWISNHINCNDIFKDILLNTKLINKIKNIGRLSYNILCVITELLSKRNPNKDVVIDIVEPFIYDFVECVNLNLKDNNKYIESTKKMVALWEKRKKQLSMPTIDKQVTAQSILTTTPNKTITSYEITNKDDKYENLTYQCCLLLSILCYDLNISPDIRSTAFELLHIYINFIELDNELIDNLALLSITVLFFSCKIWWDTFGQISIYTLLRSYHRTIHPINDYKIKYNNKVISSYIYKYETNLLLYIHFDLTTLSTITLTNKLFNNIMNRLKVSESDKIKTKDLLLHHSIGFTSLYICDNFKCLIVSCLIVTILPTNDLISQWLASMKLDRLIVDGYVNIINNMLYQWKNEIKPIVINLLNYKKSTNQSSNESTNESNSLIINEIVNEIIDTIISNNELDNNIDMSLYNTDISIPKNTEEHSENILSDVISTNQTNTFKLPNTNLSNKESIEDGEIIITNQSSNKSTDNYNSRYKSNRNSRSKHRSIDRSYKRKRYDSKERYYHNNSYKNIEYYYDPQEVNKYYDYVDAYDRYNDRYYDNYKYYSKYDQIDSSADTNLDRRTSRYDYDTRYDRDLDSYYKKYDNSYINERYPDKYKR